MRLTALIFILFSVSFQSTAGGLLGDVIEAACGKCGAGKKLDEEHKKLKEKVPVYGKIETEASNGVKDTVKTVSTLEPHGDIAIAVVKAGDDTAKEAGRAGRNLNEAAIAAGHFVENQVQAVGTTLSDAEKRVREGKIIDAIWHAATDPLKHTENNLAGAITESSLLNNVATAAASIYGGPSGAAAYASWYTYKQTGDLELALRAGVIAGATAEGLELVNGMPSSSASELSKKTLASASIGGAAVAASGGDERAIIEGFVKGAALTAAREHYNNMTDKEIEGRAPTKSALAKSDPTIKHQFKVLVDENGSPILDARGNYQIDIRSMPKNVSHVGLATADPNASTFSGAETSSLMQEIAKIPYMNDMAYYHDQWAAISQMQGLEVQATILPALVLTVTGSNTPILDQTTEEGIKNKEN